jgi:hypothetical protein
LSDDEEQGIPILVEASDSEESEGSDDEDLAKIRTWFGAMDTMSAEPKPKQWYAPVIKKSSRTMDRPVLRTEENRCLPAYVTVNGIEAFTLFDSGCTTDAISPELARVAGLKVHELTEEVPLQLGTAGGRSKIIFGTMAKMKYASIEAEHYVDIINVDKYDAIMGTIFMRKYGITVNFANDRLTINGVPAPTLTVVEEKEALTRRQSIREQVEPKAG